ncbi:MAG TPA: PQQ-dependent sugar dehydrogenase, partial [Chloroflexia bacterium]|nr:PQQ-dependent sugar dehydrogenase [Chloroflexia bacterium]
LALWGGAVALAAPAPQAAQVQVPPGFTSNVFGEGVQDARFLTYSPQGDLYVGQLIGSNSAVSILPDRNHDNAADRIVRVATDLNSPNNVTFRPAGFGTVFAAGAFDRVRVYTDTRGDLTFAESRTIVSGLSNVTTGRHKTKTVVYGPDGRLYLSKGSAFDNPGAAEAITGIWRYDADGGNGTKIASNLRNTVGLAWDAVGGALWGDDNGSDDLGRDEPHDELNHIVEGGDYGWPFCIDRRVHVSNAPAYDCGKTVAPDVLLAAHAGALGMAFYTGGSFPAHYWGGLFVAYHSVQYPAQRGVYFIPFANGRPSGPPEVFFRRTAGSTVAWNIGVAVNPYDGSLMISDDRTGQIYQVRYTGTPPAAPPPAAAPTAMAGRPRPVMASPLPGFARAFPATGHSLNGAFLQFWFWNGGLARYGFPISDPMTETLADGKSYLVQYTERARLEYHPENRGSPYVVLLGRLGADQASGRREAPFQAATPAPGATFVPQTTHNLSGPIGAYWQRNGGVPVFGYPLSEPFVERSLTDGKDYQVQYFERARLEYHPEVPDADGQILLGLLGVQSYRGRYGP